MKITVNMAISLDGFIARSNGDVSWLDAYQQDPNEDYGFGAFFASVDVLVMGRKTFEKVLSFGEWPYGDKRVVVLSGAGVEIPERLRSMVECWSGAADEIAGRLKSEGIEHVYLDGGSTVRDFLAAGLVDSMILTRVPILLGNGISLFDGLSAEVSLSHIATRSYASGLVQSEYEVIR